MEHGCGQCMPCRFNRRRVWTGRLLLESDLYPVSCFATLTYDKDHVPGELVPRDLQLFLKRLRKRLFPQKVRFYGVGEYGDVNLRPHFHIVLFGVGAGLKVGLHGAKVNGVIQRNCSCVICESWTDGLVHVGEVNDKTLAYTCKYVTKMMTSKKDKRLEGKYPEFSRMSLGGRDKKGGIGLGAVRFILDAVTTNGGAAYVNRMGDVPGRIRTSGRMWPLGRYLLGKLRADYGLDKATIDRVVAERARVLQCELMVKGARDLREQKRLQVARRANVLYQIERSKKGIGL